MAWSTASIVVEALRKLGPEATAQQLRDYLQVLQGAASIDGMLDFKKSPQRGLGLDAALVTRWDPSQRHWIPVSKPTGVPLEH
jgi:branched-chain amino acid transport system substrate-binding protein